MADDAIKRKLAQAGFHLDGLRAAKDQLAVESCFAAFMACVRSVAMYVHEWQLTNGRATTSGDWARINAWEAALPKDDHDAWRALTRMRNQDIHEEPIIPVEIWEGGWDGGWMGGWMGGWSGAAPVQKVTDPHPDPHPAQARTFPVIELCERSLRVVEQLLAVYQTL